MTKKLLLGLTLSLFTFGLFETEATKIGPRYSGASRYSSSESKYKQDRIQKLKDELKDLEYQISKYENEKKNAETGLRRLQGKDENKASILIGTIGVIDEKIKSFKSQKEKVITDIKSLDSDFVIDSQQVEKKENTLKELKSITSWTKQVTYYKALADIESDKAQYCEALARKYEAQKDILGDLGEAKAQTYRAKLKESQTQEQAYRKTMSTYQKSIDNAKAKATAPAA